MKQTGFTCDRQACGVFVVADILPDGWLVLRPQNANGEVKVKDDSPTLEFCSNTCLAITAADRALGLDDVDVVPLIRKMRRDDGTNVSPHVRLGGSAGVDQGEFARHVRWHANRGEVKPGCRFCEEATAAAKGGVETNAVTS
jgi:lipid-binding SYLF domain-containing protein